MILGVGRDRGPQSSGWGVAYSPAKMAISFSVSSNSSSSDPRGPMMPSENGAPSSVQMGRLICGSSTWGNWMFYFCAELAMRNCQAPRAPT